MTRDDADELLRRVAVGAIAGEIAFEDAIVWDAHAPVAWKIANATIPMALLLYRASPRRAVRALLPCSRRVVECFKTLYPSTPYPDEAVYAVQNEVGRWIAGGPLPDRELAEDLARYLSNSAAFVAHLALVALGAHSIQTFRDVLASSVPSMRNVIRQLYETREAQTMLVDLIRAAAPSPPTLAELVS